MKEMAFLSLTWYERPSSLVCYGINWIWPNKFDFKK